MNVEEWQGEIESKPKLRTYRLFKSEFGTEDFVKYYMTKRKRSMLSQFRSGILPLQIEVGRFTNTPLNERMCVFCDQNKIESEFHFLLECDMYNIIRNTLLVRASALIENIDDLNDDDKFVKLLKYAQKHVADYIVNSFEIRKKVLYGRQTRLPI